MLLVTGPQYGVIGSAAFQRPPHESLVVQRRRRGGREPVVLDVARGGRPPAGVAARHEARVRGRPALRPVRPPRAAGGQLRLGVRPPAGVVPRGRRCCVGRLAREQGLTAANVWLAAWPGEVYLEARKEP